MDFYFDQQSIGDLNIFSEDSSKNIFNYFNYTKTKGGKEYLYQIMNTPTSEYEIISKRKSCIQSIKESKFKLSVTALQLEFIQTYLNLEDLSPSRNYFVKRYRFYSYKIKPNNSYYLIFKGIENLLYLLKDLRNKIVFFASQKLLSQEYNLILTLLKEESILDFLDRNKYVHNLEITELDFVFRKKFLNELLLLLKSVYQLDAYISIAKSAQINNLNFAKYEHSDQTILELDLFYHPLLTNAVPYNLKITADQNLCFLTGPNMAGKSTFLKALGICVYLAHMGFPLPAASCRISILSGITTTINLSDNLNCGYSHFYSEVKRVKETAIQIKNNNNMLVIFDELFRGTNVKDAYDASLAIIKSLVNNKKSIFFISTHITEIANELKTQKNITFKCFTSELVDQKPHYTYQLHSGVCEERMGMYIVENEGILEILNSMETKNDY